MITQLSKDLQGRGPLKTFSRSGVQPVGDGSQLVLRVPRQVRARGQILAQEAIGIFIGPSLPRAMRIGQKHLDGQPLGEPLMLSHLFAPIIRQRFSQGDRDVSELLGKAVARTPRIRFP